MTLNIFLVDWKEAQKRAEQGILGAVLTSDLSDEGKWVKDLCWFDKAPADYFDVAEAWEGMTDEPEGVPAKMHETASAFMNVLVTYQDYHNDLGTGGKEFLLAISPESAARFAKLAAQVDFSRYRTAFEATCPPDTLAGFENYQPDDKQGDPFKNGFLRFMKAWVKTISDAADKKKGLLVGLQ